ncbi:DUF1287 domain-containing protein [Winogradskyella aurantiaca]|uniref:DUF1287 domain-containing protein n=1 Tax=Winogradskyella aurantiaca TaxID=2219558 RepID=UPI000E1DD86E|nr:DUF1287 domain-containing protein [Winogradskyella aurantiaca]
MRFKLFCLGFLVFSFSVCTSQTDPSKEKLVQGAVALTNSQVTYDPSYFSIAYPNGDVPSDKGVCTDVIIRAYRTVNIDLQQLVHEDMIENFSAYPNIWGLTRPDSNIDHRRVPNLMTFFSRHEANLPITNNPSDYQPGDVVAWNLGGSVTHIGIVSNKKTADKKRYLLVHNIGAGQVLEDCLFSYKIIGHYRYPN